MPIDKGSSGRDRQPNDWERIDTERSERAKAQRGWDETHDPSEEFEKAARPLPEDYGRDRPRHRELTPEQIAEIEQFTGRPIAEVLATREKDPRAGHNRDEHGRIRRPDGTPRETTERTDETDQPDGRADQPAPFEPSIAAELADREGRTGEKTDGFMVDQAGRPLWDRPMRSRLDGPAAEVGRETLGLPLRKAAIMSHVEAHAAAEMHKRGLFEATLYVNKSPCQYPGGYGCDPNLPRMLPSNAELTGYWRDDHEGPAPPGEVGPVLDDDGRSWRGKVYQAEEGDNR